MNGKILVAYASQYGATKEIAERIGQVLRRAGLQADVASVDDVREVGSYKAVILGSGVYINSWPKKSAAFLRSNVRVLAERPVWLFSSGPTGKGAPEDLLEGWRFPKELLPVADRIQPREIKVFHGNIDPSKLGFLQKFLIKNVVKKPFGDFRDWGAITSWADQIAAGLAHA
ncbi:MAG: flavodoxin domain-containing protein [Anaerolineae bacterium]